MNDDGRLGGRSLGGYYDPSVKGNLGLQLMSSVSDHGVRRFTSPRDPAYFVAHGAGDLLHRNCGLPEPQVLGDYLRDHWMENLLHMMPNNLNYAAMTEPPAAHHHPVQVLAQPEKETAEKVPQMSDMDGTKIYDLPKKRLNGQNSKSPKIKKAKKASTPKKEENGSCHRNKTENKHTGKMVINGVDLDISNFPTPICSCTGTPQQCYRWGIGGWQSACCTTNMSMYPLPISTKRRGARIAGRKMSHGAFRKVLERLINEGYHLSIPIDLKPFWAKHGTNKFVTIR